MSYEAIKSEIKQLQSALNKNNYRDTRQSLIDLQKQMMTKELVSMHRAELRNLMQAVFDRIKVFEQADQEAFEAEAAKNFLFLKEKIVEAIDFTQKNLHDHDGIWQKLLAVQQHFRGSKLLTEQREQLYDTLQKLFDLAKKRKEAAMKEQEKFSSQHFEKLDDEVAIVVSQSETADMDKAWAMLLETKDKVMNSNLVYTHRKRLLDRLQEGFVLVKIRREEQHQGFLYAAHENASAIREKLKLAAMELDNNPIFREKWELLLAVQQEFKNRKLEKETRIQLYNELQSLFERLKSQQNSDQSAFEKQADENIHYLRPLVEQALEKAQTSMDFKQTKAFLIKVQGDFKGRKMRSIEREKLYARLQTAFGILSKRLDEYIASRKEVREFRVEGRLSDVEMKIDQLEKSIAADQDKLSLLESAYQNNTSIAGAKGDTENLSHQIGIMQAAILSKQKECEDLYQEISKLRQSKDRLEGLS